jgi:serine/threonine protein kinase
MFKKKSNEESQLEDFKILKMIGKGTFGKVFLVQYNRNG